MGGRAPAAEPLARGGGRPGRADRRGGGLRRIDGPGVSCLPGTDGPQCRHVRPARPPVRVLQLRRALVRQPGHRPVGARVGRSRPAAGARACGRAGSYASGPLAGPETPGRPGLMSGAGAPDPDPRDRPVGRWSGRVLGFFAFPPGLRRDSSSRVAYGVPPDRDIRGDGGPMAVLRSRPSRRIVRAQRGCPKQEIHHSGSKLTKTPWTGPWTGWK